MSRILPTLLWARLYSPEGWRFVEHNLALGFLSFICVHAPPRQEKVVARGPTVRSLLISKPLLFICSKKLAPVWPEYFHVRLTEIKLNEASNEQE